MADHLMPHVIAQSVFQHVERHQQNSVEIKCISVHSKGRPIIGQADIKHFTDYRYRPFSKQICQ